MDLGLLRGREEGERALPRVAGREGQVGLPAIES